MDDDKVRELLGRYRPVSPSSDLRDRLLAASTQPSRTWPWAAAAAALLIATMGLHAAANRTIAAVARPAPELSVDALAAAMGGTEEARRAAESIVEERNFRGWLAGPEVVTWTIEDELNRVN